MFEKSKKELYELGLWDVYVKQKIKLHILKNIEKPDKIMQDKIINDWRIKNALNTETALNSWLKRKRIKYEEWKYQIGKDFLWTSWCLRSFKGELKNYYKKRKSSLDKYYYSIIKVKDRSLADELYLRIKEKESSFFEIALNFSEGDEKFNGGKVGPITLMDVDKNLCSIIEVSDEKQLWSPRKLNDLWIIFFLEKIINAEFNNQLRIKLSLELGDAFLHQEFLKIEEKSSK